MKLVLLLGIITIPQAAFPAVTVYMSTSAPANYQAQFIAETTTHFKASVTSSPFFAGDKRMTIYGPIKPYQEPQDPKLVTMDSLINRLVQISSDSFVYGYANGMWAERHFDLGLIGNYLVNCSSPTYFKNSSTGSWSESTCNVSLGNASMTIYQQNLSSPTFVIPGF